MINTALNLVLLGFGLVQTPRIELIRNNDTARILAEADQRLELLTARLDSGRKVENLEAMTTLLKRIARSVEKDATHRVGRRGAAVELEAENEVLFDRPPVLPPENKRHGSWTFKPVKLKVVPNHLYIYGLRFKGNHTIRLRKVTLWFRDGGPPVVHDQWFEMENGNGRAFDRRSFTPMLRGSGEQNEARPLQAIEILGSAQDGDHAADLEFMVEIPSLDAKPYEEAMTLLNRLTRKWSARDELDRQFLTEMQQDLLALKRALESE